MSGTTARRHAGHGPAEASGAPGVTGSGKAAEAAGPAPAAGPQSPPVPAAAQAGPVSHAIFRVARLHRMIAGQLLRRVGLHTGQELVMMQLWEHGPQRQADLVRLLDSDAATMTRTVQRLENAGLVRRHPCRADRRAFIIEPTAAGLALRREVERVWAELEQASTGGLTPQERAAALDVLRRLEANLARATADPADTPAARE